MELHGFAVAGWQHQRGSRPKLGTDRTEQIGRLGALIALPKLQVATVEPLINFSNVVHGQHCIAGVVNPNAVLRRRDSSTLATLTETSPVQKNLTQIFSHPQEYRR
jgi:hypothetical protein